MRFYFTALFIIFATGFSIGFIGPSIEERLSTLEKTIESCCPTQYKEQETEDTLKAYVELKRRLQHLEREVEELRAVAGVRK